MLLSSVVALAGAFGAPHAANTVHPRGAELFERLVSTWDSVRTLTYEQRKIERMRDGELVDEQIAVKVRRPGDYYIAALKPRRGQEVLYAAGRDAENILVHPGRFPDITVRLALKGRMTTHRQHHLVTHSGFDYTIERLVLEAQLARRQPAGERLEYAGHAQVSGRDAEVIVLHAGSRATENVAARPNESVFEFSNRLGVDPYLVVYSNPGIANIAARLNGGQTYVVPAYYGHRTELALDVGHGLPLRHVTWDESGNLYEQYEYENVSINPALSDADFDAGNPAYRF